MNILEFYGGENWRTDKEAVMSRCIQRLVEKVLVHNYQRDWTPDKETRHALEKGVGTNWREDQGVVGRSYIMGIIKEEWGNIKPSFLKYHRELRGGQIQNLRTELEPEVRRLLGEDWKEEAEKYIHRLEEEEKKRCPYNTVERGEGERNQEGENTKKEERNTEENMNKEENIEKEDAAKEKEEGQYSIKEETVAEEGKTEKSL